MAQMAEVLAQLRPADRRRVEQHLQDASVAIWHARQGLNGPIASQTSLDDWLAYLTTATEAVRAAADLVAPRRGAAGSV